MSMWGRGLDHDRAIHQLYADIEGRRFLSPIESVPSSWSTTTSFCTEISDNGMFVACALLLFAVGVRAHCNKLGA